MNKKLNKAELLVQAKSFLLIIGGTLILSVGSAIFLLPFELVSGGVSGIAIIINRFLPEGLISVDMIVTVITWLLFFIGLIVLGKAFAMKTLLSTIVYPIGISLFMKLASPDFLGGFFSLQLSPHSQISLILAAVFGGVFVGAGCAVTFIGGGSTGGVDIIAFSICKIFKRLKSSVVIFAVDASIVILGMFAIGDFAVSLLGICSAFIAAIMVDKVFLGSTRSFIAQVVTDKYEEINRIIIEKVDRTTTIVDITGGYSGEAKKMLIISFTMNQYAEVMNTITKTDKNAFVTIHSAHEINGEGWTR